MTEPFDNLDADLAGLGRPIIRLYDARGLGLIILGHSGVVYTNQTGGHACRQPAAEGWYVPLVDELADHESQLLEYFSGPPWNGWCDSRIHDADADFIDAALSASRTTEFIRVDRLRMAESHEAWIYVSLDPFPDNPRSLSCAVGASGEHGAFDRQTFSPVFGLSNRCGILTWSNSD